MHGLLRALAMLPVLVPLCAFAANLLTEMGPVRSAKTIVRTFAVDADCRQIGSILVNDVTACAPGEPGACLDGLALSSRLQALRLYK
jgi:hypothetical protein